MGAVGGLLGLNGGSGGTGFSTPSGTSGQQLGTAYTGVQNSMSGQADLLRAMQNQNNLQNQSNVYNQLQGVVSGQGPNPAQAMLNQATGTNVANQASLMAGQRGAGANVGLMARQAGQQGAALQQQAAGQGASMQAQQSLGALGQAQNQANTMTANQIGQNNAYAQSQQNEQGILQGANTANNQVQGQLANTTMQGQQGMIGGIMNSAGGALGLAGGGQVPGSAKSMFAKSLSASPNVGAGMGGSGGVGEVGMIAAAKGGNVGNQLKQGGHVPGQAVAKGNSYKNDTVKALLSPGEIVIPRSVLQSKDPIRGSAEFVRSVMAKKGKRT